VTAIESAVAAYMSYKRSHGYAESTLRVREYYLAYMVSFLKDLDEMCIRDRSETAIDDYVAEVIR